MKMGRYHPDDCKERYLNSKDVERLSRSLAEDVANETDRDCLIFIAQHERIHRETCMGAMTNEVAKAKLDELANRFLIAHGDWVHNASRLYWKFYNGVDESIVRKV